MIPSEPADLVRTVVVGSGAYVALVFMLKISGKRTLAKLNAFDLVVTVALGSLLASAVLDRSVGIVEATLGIGTLIALQALVSWSSVRWRPLRRIVTAEPTALVVDGVLRHDALRRMRVTEGEIRASLRGSGAAGLTEVRAVVLETDGTITVVPVGGADEWALEDIATNRTGGATHLPPPDGALARTAGAAGPGHDLASSTSCPSLDPGTKG